MATKYQQHLGDFDFGAMLKQYLTKKRIYKAALARALGVSDTQILAYQKRPSLQLGIVLQLSTILKHNFFLDIAATLPDTFTTDAPVDDTKDKRIAELEQEVMILKAQKEVLLLKRE